MISIDLIRNDPDRVRAAMADRGDHVDVEAVAKLDTQRRKLVTDADALRAQRNEGSRQLGKSKERPAAVVEEMRELGSQIKSLEQEARESEAKLDAILLTIPNLPSDDTPKGEDDSGNVVGRTEGEMPSFEFDPLPHWELGEKLDIIDFKRGVKLAGSRFYVLKSKGAALQRALITWMLKLHLEQHGYEELYIPFIVSQETLIGSGQLPKFADTMYHDDEDDMWMIPTSEVSIAGFHRDEILSPGVLPLNYTAHSPCFRREKAAAGKDRRGIKRVHQFEKVEMFKYVEPEESDEALTRLVAEAEDVCRGLGVPYRIVQLCTAALGQAAAKTFDLEMWAPGSREWLEVSSCSNCTDYQARRANIRYRPKQGARPQYVHTLNGSGLGLPRVIVSILENYQQADGSVLIPEVLQPFTGFDRIE